jgi:hypothetical protein
MNNLIEDTLGKIREIFVAGGNLKGEVAKLWQKLFDKHFGENESAKKEEFYNTYEEQYIPDRFDPGEKARKQYDLISLLIAKYKNDTQITLWQVADDLGITA